MEHVQLIQLLVNVFHNLRIVVKEFSLRVIGILYFSSFFVMLISPPPSPGSSDIQCCTSQSGMFGLDIADPASVSDINCFASSGYNDFIVPRGFRSTGAVDTNVCPNLKNAKAAGIPYRDVYMFPCPVSKSSQQPHL
jgi:hypothetical protein